VGERSAQESVDVAAVEPLPWAPLLALAFGVALLVGVAIVPGPVLDSESAASVLASQSLAGDGDRVWEAADVKRERELALRVGPVPDLAMIAVDAPETVDGKPFGPPLLYALFLAPWAALAGARGALLAQGLLFALAALYAAATLSRHVGRSAAWLPIVLLFASATGAYLLRLWPEVLLAALLLVAFALARNAHAALPPVFTAGLPEMYPEEAPVRGGRFAPRWLAVGTLLGAVASAAPWTLPLLWPAAATVPASRRRAGTVWILGGAAATLLLLAVAGAATTRTTPSLRALLAGLGWDFQLAFHPRVLAWDVAYAFAGRHLGVLFYFAPVVLFAFLGDRSQGRGAMWAGALLSLALLLLLRPFDIAGSSLALGLRAAVPLLAVLCLAVGRPPSKWAMLVTCIWAAAWLWPLWKSPRHPFDSAGKLRYAAPYLAPWAPLETTQPKLHFGSRLRFGNGRLTLLGGAALPGGSVAAVPAGEWVELLAATPAAAPGFWVEGGEQAGNELPVRGAEVSELIFRPDGGIAFLVRPKRTAARHEMPGDDRPWSFYHVSVRLPGPHGKQFTIRVRPG
jgi:hypothetical protein